AEAETGPPVPAIAAVVDAGPGGPDGVARGVHELDLPVERDDRAGRSPIGVRPGEPVARFVQRFAHRERVARAVGDVPDRDGAALPGARHDPGKGARLSEPIFTGNRQGPERPVRIVVGVVVTEVAVIAELGPGLAVLPIVRPK